MPSPVGGPAAIDLGDIYGGAVTPAATGPVAAVAAVATVAVSGAPAVAAVAVVAAPAVVEDADPPPIDLGDIYGNSSPARAQEDDDVLSNGSFDDSPASAKPTAQQPGEPAAAPDPNVFAGPDPSGAICSWQFNPADGWCYSGDTVWVYNPATQVYFDKESGSSCQYDAAGGHVVRGAMQADPQTGEIHFIPATDAMAEATGPTNGGYAQEQQQQQQGTLRDRTNMAAAGGSTGVAAAQCPVPERPGTSGRRRLDASALLTAPAAASTRRW